MKTYKHPYMDASFSPNMETTAGQCTHEECTVHEQSTNNISLKQKKTGLL